ncbi:Lipopolysaccharide export LptBFGC system [Commensalibacter communis]|uniref:Permease protein LptF (LptF) n=1 Tax=Commensalibacter communis TaxID=2972786 RepID=A0A9W4X8P6_9PROT|nr:LPS export ABC transporter permease LptG [Commensalibacter communis]CAI3924318.1 Lipopolysaccharide export LptBFGC system [Commensalibacter communis]CAI3925796.1 Lipopolysaccharide export LptBFGC system [Commensalibacter communis]CAI3925897.1 Lipopolysaccharide export LptBFGC system [Commensalibacter communis]CAI3928845.1 Lipopolysaccharide export LptBFGC system [Commensalibacter communis]CAI3928907.1 Lipopolysaccharide export LptBFGC system [Commensalibacter communis]
MFSARTISIYIAKQFSFASISMILALTALVSLFDFIDLLRRVATKPHVSTSVATSIALYHIPNFCMQILPFGILLGGIICFWRLTRSSELIVTRAAGISAWQFLTAPVLCAFGLGLFSIMIISPISSNLFRKAEILDQTYLNTSGGKLTSLSSGSLWVRQSDQGLDHKGVAILHAQEVKVQDNILHMKGISIFRLDDNDHLLVRIESPSGYLEHQHYWVLNDARSIKPDKLPVNLGMIKLSTNLSLSNIEESFSSPDTLSFWSLPGFIHLLNESGFSSISHRLRFQSLLAQPLLASTMALVAAGFATRSTRRGGVAKMIGSGVAAGFALFTISKVAEQFGESGALPALIAAWAPTAAGLCLAISLLIHLEDG